MDDDGVRLSIAPGGDGAVPGKSSSGVRYWGRKCSKNHITKEGRGMISNQILQSTVEGIKAISRVDLCVTDVEGEGIGVHVSRKRRSEERLSSVLHSLRRIHR